MYKPQEFELKNGLTYFHVMHKKHTWSELIPIADPNWIEEDFKKIKKELDKQCELSQSTILRKKALANGITYQETRQHLFGGKAQVIFIGIQGKYFLNDAWVVMTKNENILDLVKQENWKELIYYTPSKIVRALSYEEAFKTAYYTFLSDWRDDNLQSLSMKLLFAIKEIYSDKWNEDWKNEVFLGDICEFNCQYDDRYDAYFRAYNKASQPTASLLMRLAECNSCPGVPPVSKEEAKELLKKAIKLEKSYEAAHALYWLYKNENQSHEANYWKELAEEAKKEGWQATGIIPDIIEKFDHNGVFRKEIPI